LKEAIRSVRYLPGPDLKAKLQTTLVSERAQLCQRLQIPFRFIAHV
jgi:L-2-hydroxyglutarate oxidase LhgO